MIFFYTLFQLFLLPFFFLPLLLVVLFVPKYRIRTLRRLGFGLQHTEIKRNGKTIWIHALSVGEVSSALPLISGLRKEMPDVKICFSSTTQAGANLAEKLFHNKVDSFIPFPLDFLPIVKRFIRVVRPDLFILVETDFWPGILSSLQQKGIPSLLVNGRISEKSMRSYMRFPFFFKPLFASFQTLSVQNEKDKENLINLGITHNQIETLGNLKYDTSLHSSFTLHQPLSFTLPDHSKLFVAGSTHGGEDEVILKSYRQIKEQHPGVYLVIAPRDIQRGKKIQATAADMGLQANCRSQINAGGRDLFILDTIGELTPTYSHASCAFVGGSLVKRGGHNPIEPAVFAVPVIFGPHMDDFWEISRQLIQTGGAIKVDNGDELITTMTQLFTDDTHRLKTGKAAQAFVQSQQGVVQRHLRLIQCMLQ